MEPGEKVKVQSGMHQGKTGEVVDIDWDAGRVTVAVEGFGERRQVQLGVRDVQTLDGSDEEMVEKVAASIRESVWQAFETRQQLWWARRAEQGRDPSVELLESFREYRASLLDDYDDAVDETLQQVRPRSDTDDGPTPSEWLSRDASELQREWRERADADRVAFFEDVTPDDELEAIDQEVTSRAQNSSFLDEEAARQQIIQRRMSDKIDAGLDLWDACEQLDDDQ